MLREPLIAHVSKRQGSTPGPAAYNIASTFDTTPIHMKGRPIQRRSMDDRRLLSLPSTLGNVTKITLHGRPEYNPDKFNTPGPSYVPDSFGKGSRYSTFGNLPGVKSHPPSRMSMNPSFGPGPAAYNTYDHTFDGNGTRGIKMKGTHNFQYAKTDSPGPGAYAPRFNSVLSEAPKPVFHIRPKLKDPDPGVGYKQLGSTLTGPSFTMKGRIDDDINLIK